jgi:hypothetical protein
MGIFLGALARAVSTAQVHANILHIVKYILDEFYLKTIIISNYYRIF